MNVHETVQVTSHGDLSPWGPTRLAAVQAQRGGYIKASPLPPAPPGKWLTGDCWTGRIGWIGRTERLAGLLGFVILGTIFWWSLDSFFLHVGG